MVKKVLMILGVVFVILVALGLIFTIILISLGGARQRAYQPMIGFEEVFPSPLGIEQPLIVGKAVNEAPIAETPSRLVIRTGTINMVVKDIEGSLKNIIQYTEEKGGWVVSSSVTEREKVPSGSITVRVPAEIFDENMTYFRGLAERIDHEGTQGQDVTEEYTDLQSRLRNLEAAEKQLLKIMERSGTVSEILEVQRELTNIRGQIEMIKGRIQYFEESGKFATITINLALSEELLPIPPAEKWRPKYVFRQAWRSLLVTLRSISYLLIWIFVYLIILIPLGFFIWQGRKFWKKRKEAKKI